MATKGVRPPDPHPSGVKPPAIPPELVPRHVALVMDGDGRWARQRGLVRTDRTRVQIGDEHFRRKCAAAFRERLRSSDIILATHNHHTIRQYCDRGAVLAGGRLQLFDSVAGAFECYRTMLTKPE